MIQLQQNRLTATNLLLTTIQMNFLLCNDEAENGLSNSEDKGKFNYLKTYYLFFKKKMSKKMMGKYQIQGIFHI